MVHSTHIDILHHTIELHIRNDTQIYPDSIAFIFYTFVCVILCVIVRHFIFEIKIKVKILFEAIKGV